MSYTPCAEYAIPEDVKNSRVSQEEMASSRSRMDSQQGDWGERIAAEVVVAEDKLNLAAEHYDAPEYGSRQGIDSFYRDSDGKLVALEAKLSKKGIGALSYTNRGRQGSTEYIEFQADKMSTPGQETWSPTNEAIGKEILEVGAKNVRSLAVVTDPDSGVTRVYEYDHSKGRFGRAREEWDTRLTEERLGE